MMLIFMFLRRILGHWAASVASSSACRYNSEQKRGKSLEWGEIRRTFAPATDREGQIAGIPRGGRITIRVKAMNDGNSQMLQWMLAPHDRATSPELLQHRGWQLLDAGASRCSASTTRRCGKTVGKNETCRPFFMISRYIEKLAVSRQPVPKNKLLKN